MAKFGSSLRCIVGPESLLHFFFFLSRVLRPGANSVAASASTGEKSVPSVRRLLVSGEIFLGSALSASLTKLTLRAMDLLGETSSAAKDMQVGVEQGR